MIARRVHARRVGLGVVLALASLVAASATFRVPDRGERLAALGPLERLDPVLRKILLDEGAFEPMPVPGPGDWLTAHPEPGQTYPQFVASWPNRPEGARRTLTIRPIGAFAPRSAPSLDFLKRFAAAYFGLPVKELPAMGLSGQGITERRNPYTGKRQLLTGDLRIVLRQNLPADAFCLLGVTMEDLYPGPGWNFVFGEASLTERTAVYSFARYDPGFYGEPTRDGGTLRLLRSCKVLAHETGHMFGIKHCVYYACLMNGSNSMPETDAQPLHLCPVCLRKLQWSVGFDAIKRYRLLHTLCVEGGFEEEARWLAREIVRLQPPGMSR
jgi:archaemetzincin